MRLIVDALVSARTPASGTLPHRTTGADRYQRGNRHETKQIPHEALVIVDRLQDRKGHDAQPHEKRLHLLTTTAETAPVAIAA